VPALKSNTREAGGKRRGRSRCSIASNARGRILVRGGLLNFKRSGNFGPKGVADQKVKNGFDGFGFVIRGKR